MSLVRRLHLDEVVTSFPELGPTVPDGGFSWVVLSGIFLVQMTVPSLVSMYGMVLGYLAKNAKTDFDVWTEKIILTPILFTAFWSLADPWSKMIVNLASVPRLVGIIGVTLLSTGVLASGYLATGGVGAYLASSSAGAVMGIGASFVILQSDHVLRKYFRRKLLLALTLKNVGGSFGLIIVPILTHSLLNETGLKEGLLLMTIIFLPTALGTLAFRTPAPQRASPYRLLLPTEEDNELPIRISSDKNTQNQDHDSSENLDGEGSNMYAYQELEEDVDLFVNPIAHSTSKWKQQLRVLKTFRFWAAAIGWAGMRAANLFFWILLPTLALTRTDPTYPADWMILSTVAGCGTLLPNVASYKILTVTSQYRRIYFGVACWCGGLTLVGLSYATSYSWIVSCALLGGISVGGSTSCQELAVYDILGTEVARRSHKAFFTVVGLCTLIFCFVHDANFCLRFVALLQFFGGLCWIASPVLDTIKARQQRRPSHVANRDQT